MSLVSRAASDAAITCFWVLCISSLGPCTDGISSYLGVYGKWRCIVLLLLVVVIVSVFSNVGKVMGKASWNPATLLAFAAVGANHDNLLVLAARLPAQCIGAVGGVVLALGLVPGLRMKNQIKGGPSLKVDPHSGAVVEALLTFTFTFIVLLAVLRSRRGHLKKICLVSIALCPLIILGARYTGPSMNPAYAFGWAYVRNRHWTWEHVYVYIIGPIFGALLASRIFKKTFVVNYAYDRIY